MTDFTSASTYIDRKPEWICDVFLSFSPRDTSRTYVSHLHTALTQAGVLVFKNDVTLQCGDEIVPSLTPAIQGSRISIIVFSRTYATSTWPLEELEKIMECHRTIGQTVVPLFYDVVPSHVRNQTGLFGDDFKGLERFVEKEKLMSWKAALKEACNLAGHDHDLSNYRYESVQSVDIEDIVWEVTSILEKTYGLFVAYNPVGLESRLQDAIKLLKNKQPEHDLVTVDRNNRIRMHDLAKIYDVFLSFKEVDIGNEFVSHLYTSLQNAGIHAFRDNGELAKREDIAVSLFQAIGQSRISIIVLSRNYVDSRWHMLELQNIMESQRTGGLMVIPVFYDVYSSEVRSQTGEFGNGFKYLLSKIQVDEYTERNWKTTLLEVGGIPGVDVINSRNESEVIKNVVDRVINLLVNTDLFVVDYPVGVESRVQHVIQLLNSQQPKDDTLIIGMWGIGGVGKTTIAKAVYNKIRCDFEATCFLLNVRKVWKQDDDKVSLQRRLISFVYKTMIKNINTIEWGKIILEERLRQKKIFLVLDDVNNLEQLNALCGSRDWFGQGSIILITTRNMQILSQLKVDYVYKMKEMDDNESLKLLCCHAFAQPYPGEGFADLCRDAVMYCVRLPLALKVIGTFLFDKTKTEWKSALENFKIIPHHTIMESLRISFDDLSDIEKEIFLDIASFLIGMDKVDIIQILEHYGHFAETGICVLEEQCLITVDSGNRIGMHNLVQGMGKEIIRQKSMGMVEAMIYDVFLNFRGEDSRAKFVSHLYASLQNGGIYVFRDDDAIQRGDQISVSLLQAIGESRISIVVLSRNYANSRWCMLELENIMESRRTRGLVVVPVFYDVDPSEVRHQTGKFGKAFKKLLSKISVDEYTKRNWKIALLEVGGIAGVVIKNSRNESENIKKVVDQVTDLLDKTNLFVAEHPVGIESCVQYVIEQLKNQQSKDPLFLGIWGMGGIGKTTIAKAVYNKIRRDFEAKCFLLNVREVWGQDNGKVSLQQQLLSDIYKTTKINIDTVDSGKITLQERLRQKKIFLVLDDVNEFDQLNALCGSHKWFGQGSRIIITTREYELLRGLVEVNHVYEMKVMDDNESLELFSWHAFKQQSPIKGFVDLSRDFVKYSGGLPLALQVIGSFLLRRRKMEWKNELEKLKIIPNDKVLEKLIISFDGLSDDDVKEIFLDIAFFFIGMDQEDVTKILKGCGHFPEIGISVLIQRSLITVNRNNKIGMHDLLRDVGREIVRKKSMDGGKEPSRLWRHKDLQYYVLSKDTKTTDVEGLTLKLSRMDSTTYLETKEFEKMKKLRLLQLVGVQLDGDYKYLSRELKWLCWHGCPLKYTPTDFNQGSLIAVDLKYSNMERVWKKSQMLEKLKILNLSHSHNLRKTPNFSNLPNLEKLTLKDCPSLSSISPTIGELKKILFINLKDCTGLCELPRSIYKLESVKTLILSGCTKIDKLEEDIEQMKSLTTLVADKTAIARVPYAIVMSKSIGYISLCGYEGLSRDVFSSIIQSWVSPTDNVLPFVQASTGTSSLDLLDEQNHSFYGLSSIFEDLHNHGHLWLHCPSEAPLNQIVASILDDSYLENFEESGPMQKTPQISDIGSTSALIDCRSEVRISSSRNSMASLLIEMGMNCHVTNILREEISQILRRMSPNGPDLLPGNKYPDWLTFIGIGSSVTFEVPQVDGRYLKTMMCIVYSSCPDTLEGLKVVMVTNCTKNTILLCKRDALLASSLSGQEEWKMVVSNAEPGDKVEVTVVFGNKFIVKETRVYLVYDEPVEKETKHCHELDKNITASSGNENIFGRLFLRFPSIAHAVLVSPSFWFYLAGTLVWLSRGRSNKRSRHRNPILREMESESSQGFNNSVPRDEIPLSDVYEEVKRQG